MNPKQLVFLMVAIVVSSLIGMWVFTYEEEYREYGRPQKLHRNRFTGATCYSTDSCWLERDLIYRSN